MDMADKNKPFKPQFPGQHEDEEVQLVFHQHFVVARKPFIYGLLAILVAIVPLDFQGIYTINWLPAVLYEALAVVLVAVIAVWLWAWVGWYYTVYILTGRRLVSIRQKGFFDRSVQEWQLDKIYNVNYHVDGLQAMMFNYGDISLKTAIGEFIMTKIHRPIEVYKRILMAVREVSPQNPVGLIDNSVSMM